MKTRSQNNCLKIFLLLLLTSMVIWLMGCSVKREIIMPDQTVYTVKAQKDDLVSFKLSKDGDIEFTVDGRGRPGMIEQALGIMFMNLPQVELNTN